ncbi:MAG: HD domain-containing protein [Spirochaetota bacterium]|jgi:HD-GYP domain-containing protein (c-di-GMP phosphodiesterase class II)|nr:HD domain-containing protein [Spirochaetota bacterium]
MTAEIVSNSRKNLADILKITEDMNRIKDIDVLLEKILYEARRFTNSDAGSIYLREGNFLLFSYVQNDTLAARDPSANKHIYVKQALEINEKSISGYVALTGKTVCIPDVYKIDENLPYSFNRSFDQKAGYRTKSLLTVPLITSQQITIGVMQILNSRSKIGVTKAFSGSDIMHIIFFANNASLAIERAKMMRELVMRMIRMAEYRDPKETGNHVRRVSAYSVEIFDNWAQHRGMNREEILKNKDMLSIAAMLHDVGKVAISDTILKKPARLTEEEYTAMKAHTLHGAHLFNNPVSDWDMLAAEVARTHHERWDGGGYPGNKPGDGSEDSGYGTGLAGEDIPIFGRIVALADVFDALISKRAYKEEWGEKQVLEYIREQAGKQFDPEVTEAFFRIYETINSIRQFYPDGEG